MQRIVTSFMRLRAAIGWTGMLLPVLVWAGGVANGLELQKSISQYWWTPSRDVFVGVLAVAGALLLAYKGYDAGDRRTTFLAGVSAFLIAIFPAAWGMESISYLGIPGDVSGVIHYGSAILFFGLLGYMSYFRFTKGHDRKRRKRQRNKVFRVCGIVIFASLAAMIVGALAFPEWSEESSLVFWFESVMLVAFGISWAVKGQVILHDIARKG